MPQHINTPTTVTTENTDDDPPSLLGDELHYPLANFFPRGLLHTPFHFIPNKSPEYCRWDLLPCLIIFKLRQPGDSILSMGRRNAEDLPYEITIGSIRA
jgi:hypothetical protein